MLLQITRNYRFGPLRIGQDSEFAKFWHSVLIQYQMILKESHLRKKDFETISDTEDYEEKDKSDALLDLGNSDDETQM